ncbi:hypothetical protein RHS01_05780 [Rhizoctonia solani]|uniref:Uncharacterized protein n=1 Tax=Rhizoctonia solani TaxID=456999 RepID=A0A8H7M1L1_9AGAM|nr:hypothetical protein RHS01_05780 [Rhizoctonia solani]
MRDPRSSATNNKLASWANAWLHFVLLHDSDSAELQWGTGRSKGLTAACYFLWMIGAACDWYLKRKIGEDPEEASRKGTFIPIKSRWDTLKEKLFANANSSRAENSLLFSSKSHVSPTLPKFHQDSKAPPVFRPRVPGHLPRPYDSDSDSIWLKEEKQWKILMKGNGLRLRTIPMQLLSIQTVFSMDKDAERSPELNLGPHRIEPSKDNDDNWRPVFLKRSDSIKSTSLEVAEVESRDVTTMAPAALHSYDIPGHPISDRHGSNSTAPLYALLRTIIHAWLMHKDKHIRKYGERGMNNCAAGVLSENRSYPTQISAMDKQNLERKIVGEGSGMSSPEGCFTLRVCRGGTGVCPCRVYRMYITRARMGGYTFLSTTSYTRLHRGDEGGLVPLRAYACALPSNTYASRNPQKFRSHEPNKRQPVGPRIDQKSASTRIRRGPQPTIASDARYEANEAQAPPVPHSRPSTFRTLNLHDPQAENDQIPRQRQYRHHHHDKPVAEPKQPRPRHQPIVPKPNKLSHPAKFALPSPPANGPNTATPRLPHDPSPNKTTSPDNHAAVPNRAAIARNGRSKRPEPTLGTRTSPRPRPVSTERNSRQNKWRARGKNGSHLEEPLLALEWAERMETEGKIDTWDALVKELGLRWPALDKVEKQKERTERWYQHVINKEKLGTKTGGIGGGAEPYYVVWAREHMALAAEMGAGKTGEEKFMVEWTWHQSPPKHNQGTAAKRVEQVQNNC